MYISDSIKYVGVNDLTTDLFEGQYKIPSGISYNSYVILDEKIAVMDSVDASFGKLWLDNISSVIGDREPDYLVVHHMEPDHSANIKSFLDRYPSSFVVSSQKAFAMMKGYFGTDFLDRRIVVSEGSVLELGAHSLTFVSAPMVHWPEVMVSYDSLDKVLFSADGFGKFGAIGTDEPWADEARRYYIGIVGKYGAQVQNLLKKASALDIAKICPLHGPVLSEDLSYYLGLYDKWSSYVPEAEGITVAYTSVYGNTRLAVDALVNELASYGVAVECFDLARCDMSEAVASAFKNDRLVLATTTYNADIFPFMREYIDHLTERGFKNRRVGLIENGSWAPMAAKIMRARLEPCRDLSFAETAVKISCSPDAEAYSAIKALAAELAK